MDRHSGVECGQDQLRRRGGFGRRYGAMTTGCQMERRQARAYRLVSEGMPRHFSSVSVLENGAKSKSHFDLV